jgi:hypothetical protein
VVEPKTGQVGGVAQETDLANGESAGAGRGAEIPDVE